MKVAGLLWRLSRQGLPNNTRTIIVSRADTQMVLFLPRWRPVLYRTMRQLRFSIPVDTK